MQQKLTIFCSQICLKSLRQTNDYEINNDEMDYKIAFSEVWSLRLKRRMVYLPHLNGGEKLAHSDFTHL